MAKSVPTPPVASAIAYGMMPLTSAGGVVNTTLLLLATSDANGLAPRFCPLNNACAPLFVVRASDANRVNALLLMVPVPGVRLTTFRPWPLSLPVPNVSAPMAVVPVFSAELAVPLPSSSSRPPLRLIEVLPLTRLARCAAVLSNTRAAPWLTMIEPTLAAPTNAPVAPVAASVPLLTVMLPVNELVFVNVRRPAPAFWYAWLPVLLRLPEYVTSSKL